MCLIWNLHFTFLSLHGRPPPLPLSGVARPPRHELAELFFKRLGATTATQQRGGKLHQATTGLATACDCCRFVFLVSSSRLALGLVAVIARNGHVVYVLNAETLLFVHRETSVMRGSPCPVL